MGATTWDGLIAPSNAPEDAVPIPIRHALSHGPTFAALAAVATGRSESKSVEVPGPEHHVRMPPRPEAMVQDYLRWLGVSPKRYKGQLPPHLFAEWGFPVLVRCLGGLPYPLAQVINGGCSLVSHKPIPTGEALDVRGRLSAIDEDDRRVIFTCEIITSTRSAADALVAESRIIIRKPRKKGAPRGPKKDPVVVPLDAREVATRRFSATAGREFAVLTGDFNPIHWIPAAGRAAGFGGCILHGFATLATAWEGLVDGVLSGDAAGVRGVDVRFSAPLRLPGQASLFVDGDALMMGSALGAPAVLTGTWTRENSHE